MPEEGVAPVKTWLITGFLGAGKTTLIREQLKTAGARVAVLVNEFGELGVDGALIRAAGDVEVLELPGGCICCSQKEGLVQSVAALARGLAPNLLLIEPSGIAETSELLRLLAAPALEGVIQLEGSVAVLDAETFLVYSEPDTFGSFFLDQVQNADVLVLNKRDLVDEGELACIEARLAELAPGAVVLGTEYCRLNGALMSAGNRCRAGTAGREAALLGLTCLSLPLDGALSRPELSALVAEIASGRYGEVLRSKGLVPVAGQGLLELQLVGSRSTLEPFAGSAAPRLTLIGRNLERGLLAARLGALSAMEKP